MVTAEIIDNPSELKAQLNDKPVESALGTPPEGYVRLELPSHCICYDWKELYIRPFKVSDILKLSHARDGGASVVIDTVGNALYQTDVRTLTIGDFIFIMGWLRINSFHKSPFEVVYMSRYGNENKVRVTSTNLKTEELAMTREQYFEGIAAGYNMPRVSDMEQQDASDPEKELAQWFYAPDVPKLEDRIKLMNSQLLDMTWLEGLKKWRESCKHGITESITATDEHFKVETYITTLQDKIKDYTYDVNMLAKNGRAGEAIILNREIQLMEEELEEIQAKIKDGKEVRAEPEEVAFEVSAASFLSLI